MRITKNTEVVTEAILVEPGVYYFETNLIVYKMELGEKNQDGYSSYKLTKIENFGNRFGIMIVEDSSDEAPYQFKEFILGTAGKKIEKELFEEEKVEALKRIS